MLLRDELANLGWAVERRLESPLEVGIETARDVVDLAPAPEAPREVPVYRLASPVPAHWIPLLPVRVADDSAEVRLARGAVLDLSGVPRTITSRGPAARPRRGTAADPRGGGAARRSRGPSYVSGGAVVRRPAVRLGRQPRLGRQRRGLQRPRLRRPRRVGEPMNDFLDSMLQALNSHDPQRLAALFAEDYRSAQPAHPGREFVGPTARSSRTGPRSSPAYPTSPPPSSPASRTATPSGASGPGRAPTPTAVRSPCAA